VGGRGEGFREVTRTHLACRRRGALVYTPFVFVPTVAKPSSSYEKVESWRPMIFSSRFSSSSMSLAKTLTVVVDRFEGYGVIKCLVKRDREESRGEKERNRSRRLQLHNLRTNI